MVKVRISLRVLASSVEAEGQADGNVWYVCEEARHRVATEGIGLFQDVLCSVFL